MSHTLDAILDQAMDNYSITATLSPENVAVLLYALSQIENPDSWLDTREDQLDEITDTDRDEIDELIAGANMAIITPDVGHIKAYITTIPPDNTLACDGSTYARLDYPLLYSVLDSAYIIDADYFSVPNFEGRFLVGVGTLSSDAYNLGDSGGLSQVQITEGQLASHSHSIPSITSFVTQEGVGVARNITVPLVTDSTGVTGNDESHENRPPFGTVKYCVVAR